MNHSPSNLAGAGHGACCPSPTRGCSIWAATAPRASAPQVTTGFQLPSQSRASAGNLGKLILKRRRSLHRRAKSRCHFCRGGAILSSATSWCSEVSCGQWPSSGLQYDNVIKLRKDSGAGLSPLGSPTSLRFTLINDPTSHSVSNPRSSTWGLPAPWPSCSHSAGKRSSE